MPSMAQFADFVKSTGPTFVSSPEEILNDAVRNNYFFARMLRGRGADEVLQGGASIQERVQLSHSGTAAFYDPNETLSITSSDTLRSISVPWRFLADYYTYTQQEINLNASGDPRSFYKNLLKSKRQSAKTSIFEKLEDALWAVPSNAQMEASTGKQPYSFPTFLTPSGTYVPSGFTTIEGLNPTTETGFRNQTETYDPSNLTDGTTGLTKAFDRMFLKARFTSPTGGPSEYFESDDLNKLVIASNLDGVTTLQNIVRNSNDRIVPDSTNLGYVAGRVTYAGLPIEWVSTLDTALINSGAAISTGKPWFYFLNLKYIYTIFHKNNYFAELDPMSPPNQPFSAVVWTSLYTQLFCRSRKRQGLITPTA